MPITSEEAREIATTAAEQALMKFAAAHPVPSSLSSEQAAEILGVSARTVARMKLKRNAAGKITYAAVVEALASR